MVIHLHDRAILRHWFKKRRIVRHWFKNNDARRAVRAVTTPKLREAIRTSDEPASVLAARFGSLEDQKTIQ